MYCHIYLNYALSLLLLDKVETKDHSYMFLVTATSYKIFLENFIRTR